jgi:hypothetical protein
VERARLRAGAADLLMGGGRRSGSRQPRLRVTGERDDHSADGSLLRQGRESPGPRLFRLAFPSIFLPKIFLPTTSGVFVLRGLRFLLFNRQPRPNAGRFGKNRVGKKMKRRSRTPQRRRDAEARRENTRRATGGNRGNGEGGSADPRSTPLIWISADQC